MLASSTARGDWRDSLVGCPVVLHRQSVAAGGRPDRPPHRPDVSRPEWSNRMKSTRVFAGGQDLAKPRFAAMTGQPTPDERSGRQGRRSRGDRPGQRRKSTSEGWMILAEAPRAAW